jgi:hypothetical protein
VNDSAEAGRDGRDTDRQITKSPSYPITNCQYLSG